MWGASFTISKLLKKYYCGISLHISPVIKMTCQKKNLRGKLEKIRKTYFLKFYLKIAPNHYIYRKLLKRGLEWYILVLCRLNTFLSIVQNVWMFFSVLFYQKKKGKFSQNCRFLATHPSLSFKKPQTFISNYM